MGSILTKKMTKNDFYSDAPLYMALKKYLDKDMSSFHTPGHKGCADILNFNLSFDLTELPETDSLFECDGAIRASEIKAAELFGAKYTAVSAGGCTLAIQGMLAAFSKSGDKVIFSRNIHRSAINTAILLGLTPLWVMHRNDCGAGLPGRIYPQDVRTVLEKNPDAAVVYITSPDYYGCISDIAGISKVCHEFGVPLLVDNAHGTHLVSFGKHPIQLGASASACSAHKTLPVLTGGAWMNCSDENAAKRIKRAMALFGSTSPLYLTMASLDIARAWMQAEGMVEFRRLAREVDRLKELAVSVGFDLPPGECDPTRLTLLTSKTGFNGNDAAEYFRQRGAECEHSDNAAVIFIITPFNSEHDIDRLKNAIAEFPCRRPVELHTNGQICLPKRAMLPQEVLRHEQELISTATAENRIAAEAACPCPPGVPLIMPGEIIDAKCVKILLSTGINQIVVLQ